MSIPKEVHRRVLLELLKREEHDKALELYRRIAKEHGRAYADDVWPTAILPPPAE